MKMYILVKKSVNPGIGIVGIAHASLACYLKFQDNSDMIEWLEKSFKKVVCLVSDDEFNDAKLIENNFVITESSINGLETVIAFCPRKEYPKQFKFYKLYKPQLQIY